MKPLGLRPERVERTTSPGTSLLPSSTVAPVTCVLVVAVSDRGLACELARHALDLALDLAPHDPETQALVHGLI